VVLGTHLTLTVAVAEPGDVAIPRLGRTASATPDAPAVFDLLAPDPGRYDVLFSPAAGEPSRVGTIVSRARR
jgi:hypothetical protein